MGQPSRRNHESPGRILDRFKAHFGQDNVFMDSLHAGGQSQKREAQSKLVRMVLKKAASQG
jgi:hypothetical protein